MKKAGLVLLAIALFGLIASLGMDTSVSSGNSRVHNIGLMNQQQNFLLISVALGIIGAIFIAVGSRTKAHHSLLAKGESNQSHHLTRKCPYCAEIIMAEAIVCRYCKHDIIPIEEKPPEVNTFKSAPKIDIQSINKFFKKIENAIRKDFNEDFSLLKNIEVGSKPTKSLPSWTPQFSKSLDIFAITLIAIWALSLISRVAEVGFKSLQGPGDERYYIIDVMKHIAPVFFSAIFILFRNKMRKPSALLTPRNALNGNQIEFFGETFDLAIFQIAMIMLVWLLHADNQYKLAYATAMLGIALGFLFYKFISKTIGLFSIIFGILYIYQYHALYRTFSYQTDKLIQSFSNPLNGMLTSYDGFWKSYLWVFFAALVFPHMRLIRLDNLHFGRMRGDTKLSISDHDIFLPITSALVLLMLIRGIPTAFSYARMLFSNLL